MINSSKLDANLWVLGSRWPQYADLITAIPSSEQYRLEEKDGAVLCRDPSGAWLHGPGNPWRAAIDDSQQLARLAPRLYVVVRPGLGYQALALVRAVSEKEPGSVILIVEDRLELMRLGLELLDWREALSFRGSVLLLGDPASTIEGYVKRHPALQALPITLVATGADAERVDYLSCADRLETSGAAFRESMEGKFVHASNVMSERRTRRAPRRVLLAGDDLGYLSQPLRTGFAALGCDVVSWDFNRNGTPRDVLAADSLPALLDYLPDVLLWINQPELSRVTSEAARALGIASILWSVDSPRRVGLVPADYRLVDWHLSFDANHLEPSTKQKAQLSVGAGLQPLRGCTPRDSRWPRREGPKVSFVGSYGDGRIRELRDALWQHDSNQIKLLDELALATGDPGPAFEAATGSSYRRSPCIYVDEVRTMRRRAEVLAAIPDGALQIFGSSEWAKAGAVARAYAGRTKHYGFDLGSLYFQSQINLNVFHEQCVDSTNSRVYDVLASGGFLLTEYRPCLEREFKVGTHLATFSSPEEARSKVLYYLEHEAEREEMARQGQRHVLANHTFAHRCQRVLDLAQSSIEGFTLDGTHEDHHPPERLAV